MDKFQEYEPHGDFNQTHEPPPRALEIDGRCALTLSTVTWSTMTKKDLAQTIREAAG